MIPTTLKSSRENVMYNTLIKTYRDGSKQLLCATKRIFREPGWESRVVSGVKQIDLVAEAEDLWWSYFNQNVRKPDESRDDYLDPDLDWHNLPVEEMTVGQLARLDEEEARQAAKQRESLRRSLRRARVKVRDYCLSTDMAWFVTLTLDEAKINRYDIKEITKVLNVWLNHLVQRCGLCYVMVPELHKDGAIHFHAIINDVLETEDSGTIIPRGQDKPRMPRNAAQRGAWLRDGGRIVYNLPQWPYGFTTALKMEGNYERVVNYVCKYISKGLSDDPGDVLPTKVGGRWYYSGGDLKSPGIEFCNNNMEELESALGDAARRVEVEDLENVELIVAWINADGTAREMPKPKQGGGGKKHGSGKP